MALLPTAPADAYWASLADYMATKDPADRRESAAALRRWRRRQISEAAQNMLIRLAAEPEQDIAWQQWFWFNHFNILASKQQIAPVLKSYLHDAIDLNLKGRFVDLLKAVTLHPAMLMYLDNVRNIKGKGNENHARELLELHTLGVGGGYGQADVVAAAQIMTGWGVALRGDPAEMGVTTFNARQHEDGSKQVLHRIFASDSEKELPALLEHLAAQPATAKHVATKIAIWVLGDAPRASEVNKLTAVYRQTKGHLPTLWHEAQRLLPPKGEPRDAGGHFKDPLRYVTSAVKLLLGDEVVTHAKPLELWVRLLGQPMFGRGSPDGYPVGGADWLSAGQLSQRVELAQEMVTTAPNLGEASVIRQRLQKNPMSTPQAAPAIQRLPEQHRMAIDKAKSPAQAWALLLASPGFMSS